SADPQHMRDFMIERLGKNFEARNLGYRKLGDGLVERTLAGAVRTGRRLDYELKGRRAHTDAYVFKGPDDKLVSVTFQNDVDEEDEAPALFGQIAESLEIGP